ncbi:MAG: AbrB/MazE/SpoVT family DNA-binding domain-containing protein [Candidatus Limnocylindrales bacterium]
METLVPADTELVNLRAKNQLTLPDAIAKQVGVEPGDRFRAWVQDDGSIILRRCSRSAYGRYPHVWGDTPEETAEHLRELRDEWERDRPSY